MGLRFQRGRGPALPDSARCTGGDGGGSATCEQRRPYQPWPQFTVYRGYFVEFPNESAYFNPFFAAVYSFTSLYTKNVWTPRVLKVWAVQQHRSAQIKIYRDLCALCVRNSVHSVHSVSKSESPHVVCYGKTARFLSRQSLFSRDGCH